MKTWVKLYTEILHDPDQGSLTWAQRGMWAALLALAGQVDDRDDQERETGRVGTLEEVRWHLRCDAAELSEAMAAFEARGMVEERDGQCYLPNYAKRQARPESARRDAVAERVRQHRRRKASECNEGVTTLHDEGNEDVTRVKCAVTPSDTDTDTDTEKNTPANAGAPAAPRSFQDWQKIVRDNPNHAEAIYGMIRELYPNIMPPTYARIGAAAKAVNSWGRLTEYVWNCSSRPPTGDLMDFIIATHKGNKGNRTNGSRASPTVLQPAVANVPVGALQESAQDDEWQQALAALLEGDDD